jgi:ABC-type branched-subunit amino acid transport system ATPase component
VQPDFAATAGASLELDNVSKNFGGLQALRDVSFRVAPGSIHALIGPNGAGKTTLINVITGFYRTDGGAVLINGQAANISSMHDAARRGVVRTFQTMKLFGDMTVLEHVLIGLACHSGAGFRLLGRVRAREQAARNLAAARELIALVGLSRFEQTPSSALAYGHRRLLEIARALAVQPKVLLLDEPAAGLITEEIASLAEIIRKLRAAGMTVLLIEHHIDLVVSISDRVTVLDYGAVIADGPPAAVQRDERVIAAYLGPAHALA